MLWCQVYDSTKHAYGSQQAWVAAIIEVWEIWLSAIRSLSCSLYRPLGPTVILRVYCFLDSSPETGRLWCVDLSGSLLSFSLFSGWQRLDWLNGPLPVLSFFHWVCNGHLSCLLFVWKFLFISTHTHTGRQAHRQTDRQTLKKGQWSEMFHIKNNGGFVLPRGERHILKLFFLCFLPRLTALF